MSFSDQEVGDVLANYADVIEGGNTHRGSGTEHKGIPGTDSVADELPIEITASANGLTTRVVDATRAWSESDRWSKSGLPPFYLVCSSATNTQNIGVGRKISSWNASSTYFTTAAFPAATSIGDTFDIREGFARIRDGIDIEGEEGEEVGDGFDRMFQLDFEVGEPELVYGRNVERFRGALVLRVRFLKRHRLHAARARAFSNIMRLRTLIPRPEHLDATYVRALFSEGAPDIRVDGKKIVVEDRFTMIYSLNTYQE